MSTPKHYKSPAYLARRIRSLRAQRRKKRLSGKGGVKRRRLTPKQRAEVLLKTGHRCHICGGSIGKEPWEADHVLAHTKGGEHSLDNYLAAHKQCNRMRWHHEPEESQWILKMGIWLRGEIERGSEIGELALEKFWAHQNTKSGR